MCFVIEAILAQSNSGPLEGNEGHIESVHFPRDVDSNAFDSVHSVASFRGVYYRRLPIIAYFDLNDS